MYLQGALRRLPSECGLSMLVWETTALHLEDLGGPTAGEGLKTFFPIRGGSGVGVYRSCVGDILGTYL